MWGKLLSDTYQKVRTKADEVREQVSSAVQAQQATISKAREVLLSLGGGGGATAAASTSFSRGGADAFAAAAAAARLTAEDVQRLLQREAGEIRTVEEARDFFTTWRQLILQSGLHGSPHFISSGEHEPEDEWQQHGTGQLPWSDNKSSSNKRGNSNKVEDITETPTTEQGEASSLASSRRHHDATTVATPGRATPHATAGSRASPRKTSEGEITSDGTLSASANTLQEGKQQQVGEQQHQQQQKTSPHYLTEIDRIGGGLTQQEDAEITGRGTTRHDGQLQQQQMTGGHSESNCAPAASANDAAMSLYPHTPTASNTAASNAGGSAGHASAAVQHYHHVADGLRGRAATGYTSHMIVAIPPPTPPTFAVALEEEAAGGERSCFVDGFSFKEIFLRSTALERALLSLSRRETLRVFFAAHVGELLLTLKKQHKLYHHLLAGDHTDVRTEAAAPACIGSGGGSTGRGVLGDTEGHHGGPIKGGTDARGGGEGGLQGSLETRKNEGLKSSNDIFTESRDILGCYRSAGRSEFDAPSSMSDFHAYSGPHAGASSSSSSSTEIAEATTTASPSSPTSHNSSTSSSSSSTTSTTTTTTTEDGSGCSSSSSTVVEDERNHTNSTTTTTTTSSIPGDNILQHSGEREKKEQQTYPLHLTQDHFKQAQRGEAPAERKEEITGAKGMGEKSNPVLLSRYRRHETPSMGCDAGPITPPPVVSALLALLSLCLPGTQEQHLMLLHALFTVAAAAAAPPSSTVSTESMQQRSEQRQLLKDFYASSGKKRSKDTLLANTSRRSSRRSTLHEQQRKQQLSGGSESTKKPQQQQHELTTHDSGLRLDEEGRGGTGEATETTTTTTASTSTSTSQKKLAASDEKSSQLPVGGFSPSCADERVVDRYRREDQSAVLDSLVAVAEEHEQQQQQQRRAKSGSSPSATLTDLAAADGGVASSVTQGTAPRGEPTVTQQEALAAVERVLLLFSLWKRSWLMERREDARRRLEEEGRRLAAKIENCDLPVDGADPLSTNPSDDPTVADPLISHNIRLLANAQLLRLQQQVLLLKEDILKQQRAAAAEKAGRIKELQKEWETQDAAAAAARRTSGEEQQIQNQMAEASEALVQEAGLVEERRVALHKKLKDLHEKKLSLEQQHADCLQMIATAEREQQKLFHDEENVHVELLHVQLQYKQQVQHHHQQQQQQERLQQGLQELDSTAAGLADYLLLEAQRREVAAAADIQRVQGALQTQVCRHFAFEKTRLQQQVHLLQHHVEVLEQLLQQQEEQQRQEDRGIGGEEQRLQLLHARRKFIRAAHQLDVMYGETLSFAEQHRHILALAIRQQRQTLHSKAPYNSQKQTGGDGAAVTATGNRLHHDGEKDEEQLHHAQNEDEEQEAYIDPMKDIKTIYATTKKQLAPYITRLAASATATTESLAAAPQEARVDVGAGSTPVAAAPGAKDASPSIPQTTKAASAFILKELGVDRLAYNAEDQKQQEQSRARQQQPPPPQEELQQQQELRTLHLPGSEQQQGTTTQLKGTLSGNGSTTAAAKGNREALQQQHQLVNAIGETRRPFVTEDKVPLLQMEKNSSELTSLQQMQQQPQRQQQQQALRGPGLTLLPQSPGHLSEQHEQRQQQQQQALDQSTQMMALQHRFDGDEEKQQQVLLEQQARQHDEQQPVPSLIHAPSSVQSQQEATQLFELNTPPSSGTVSPRWDRNDVLAATQQHISMHHPEQQQRQRGGRTLEQQGLSGNFQLFGDSRQGLPQQQPNIRTTHIGPLLKEGEQLHQRLLGKSEELLHIMELPQQHQHFAIGHHQQQQQQQQQSSIPEPPPHLQAKREEPTEDDNSWLL